MKRFCCLAVLTLLSSSAYAGEQVSFVVAGHRIHIEASRFCRSPSCASISISGIYQSHPRGDRLDDDRRVAPEPVKAPQTVPSILVAPPAGNPPVQPALPAAAPIVFKPAVVATQPVAAPPPPPALPIEPARIAPAPPAPPVEKPAEIVRPAPVAAPQLSKVSHEVADDPADTPVGDWQTEGKGSIRIARCGQALCGYVLNSSSNDRGEAVLINMKPNSKSKWTGNVSSHDSGDIYYGTMQMTGPNKLRVEACALGRFYCSGNAWSRIVTGRGRLISSRQISPEPRT
jgi:uncharacterized protein (DUF2147 family)